jgi:hypothetical protein
VGEVALIRADMDSEELKRNVMKDRAEIIQEKY